MSALRVAGLRVAFESADGPVEVVSGVDLHVGAGEAVALVGESGCGKSVTARSILRLLPDTARVSADRLEVGGAPVLELGARDLRTLRGKGAGFIFQDPMTALNPVFPVGEQIAERLRRYAGLDRKAAAARAVELLTQVGIPAAAQRARAYPHQLSGGMRQRVVVAIALACDPPLLIADEPTTALDVTIQAQIMVLLAAQRRAREMALLMITHDLGLVAQWVDRVVVMYAGQVVEDRPVEALFASPRHPYTRGLLHAVPGVTEPGEDGRLWTIPGAVPPPRAFSAACRFAPRCDRVAADCEASPIPVRDDVRCLHPYA